MKSRVSLAIAIAASSFGCEALVGISDLPIDGGISRDGTIPFEDASVADVGADDAVTGDDATEDVSRKDAAGRDVAVRDTGPRDGATDRSVIDGPTLVDDASDATVDRRLIPDAGMDHHSDAASE